MDCNHQQLHISYHLTTSTSLRSADQLFLLIRKITLKNGRDGAFTVIASKLWSELPLHIRLTPTLQIFKYSLKLILCPTMTLAGIWTAELCHRGFQCV